MKNLFSIKSSVSKKIGMIIVLSTVFVLGLNFLFQAYFWSSFIKDDALEKYDNYNKFVSSQLSGAVKWQKVRSIERIYTAFVDQQNSYVNRILVFDNEKRLLAEYVAPEYQQEQLKADNTFYGSEREVFSENFIQENNFNTISNVDFKGDLVGYLVTQWNYQKIAQDIQAMIFSKILTNDVPIALITIGTLIILISLSTKKVFLDPFSRVAKATLQVANGVQLKDIPEQEREDEVGKMASSLNIFRESAKQVEILNQRSVDIAKQNEERFKNERFALSDAIENELNSTVGELNQDSLGLKDFVDGMAQSAQSMSQNINNVFENSSQSEKKIQQVVASAEDLLVSIHDIRKQAEQAAEISKNAVSASSETNDIVTKLSDSAAQINEIISIISDIAEQTNLLALNATIEAARAGDAGKGFAVVASEVKNLANQTSQASDEITTQIREIQEASQLTIKAIKDISKKVCHVDEISHTIADSVNAQATSTEGISQSSYEVADATRASTSAIASTVDAAKNTNQMTEQMNQSVNNINQRVSLLKERLSDILKQHSGFDISSAFKEELSDLEEINQDALVK